MRWRTPTVSMTEIDDAQARTVAGRDPDPAVAKTDRHTAPLPRGKDVLVEEGFRALRRQLLRLVTNQTGRTHDGRSTIDIRFDPPAVKLLRILTSSTASAAMPTGDR
jgi:hypothetical protein